MLRIKERDLQTIVDHCDREYPNEACGILAGRESTVEHVYSLASEKPSPVSYRIGSAEHFRVFHEMRARGTTLLGMYHSHPEGPAFPSSLDVKSAYYPETVYVIVSLQDRKNPSIKGFRIMNGNVTEVPLESIERAECRTVCDRTCGPSR